MEYKILHYVEPIEVEKDGKTEFIEQDPIEVENQNLDDYLVFDHKELVRYLKEKVEVDEKEIVTQASIILPEMVEKSRDKIYLLETPNKVQIHLCKKDDLPDAEAKAYFSTRESIVVVDIKLKDLFLEKTIKEI